MWVHTHSGWKEHMSACLDYMHVCTHNDVHVHMYMYAVHMKTHTCTLSHT